MLRPTGLIWRTANGWPLISFQHVQTHARPKLPISRKNNTKLRKRRPTNEGEKGYICNALHKENLRHDYSATKSYAIWLRFKNRDQIIQSCQAPEIGNRFTRLGALPHPVTPLTPPRVTERIRWGVAWPSHTSGTLPNFAGAPSHLRGVTEFCRCPLSHLRGVTEFCRCPLSHLRGVTEFCRCPLSHLQGVTEFYRPSHTSRALPNFAGAHLRGVTEFYRWVDNIKFRS